MTPRLDTGESGGHPLQPVASDTSMPANSASGCVSQVTPGSTAATRMLSPLSGGAISGPDFGPSPSERATAVLARASRHGHTSPAQIPPPSNSTSLAEQPSLMPMARLLEKCASHHVPLPAFYVTCLRNCSNFMSGSHVCPPRAVPRLHTKPPWRRSGTLPAP